MTSRRTSRRSESVDPFVTVNGTNGPSYQGFFFEARDADGAFLRTWDTHRAQVAGGQWAACRSHFPYPTGGDPLSVGLPAPERATSGRRRC